MNTKPFRAILALFPLLAAPALAEATMPEAPPPSYGLAFSVLDPGKALRDSVAPDIRERIVQRVHADTRRGDVWTTTMFSGLAVVSGELDRLAAEGHLDGPARQDIAKLAAVALADFLVEVHAELLPALATFTEDTQTLGNSPIERICECDKSGSRACGCLVNQGGSACTYSVICPSVLRASCSAVNLHLCIAETVGEIFFAEPRELRPSEAPRARPARTREGQRGE